MISTSTIAIFLITIAISSAVLFLSYKLSCFISKKTGYEYENGFVAKISKIIYFVSSLYVLNIIAVMALYKVLFFYTYTLKQQENSGVLTIIFAILLYYSAIFLFFIALIVCIKIFLRNNTIEPYNQNNPWYKNRLLVTYIFLISLLSITLFKNFEDYMRISSYYILNTLATVTGRIEYCSLLSEYTADECVLRVLKIKSPKDAKDCDVFVKHGFNFNVCTLNKAKLTKDSNLCLNLRGGLNYFRMQCIANFPNTDVSKIVCDEMLLKSDTFFIYDLILARCLDKKGLEEKLAELSPKERVRLKEFIEGETLKRYDDSSAKIKEWLRSIGFDYNNL